MSYKRLRELLSLKQDKSDAAPSSEPTFYGSSTAVENLQLTQSYHIHEIVPTTFTQWTSSSISSSLDPLKESLANQATGPCNLLTRKLAYEVSQPGAKLEQLEVLPSTPPTFQSSPFSMTKKNSLAISLPVSEKDK